jgi:hypothetical protein
VPAWKLEVHRTGYGPRPFRVHAGRCPDGHGKEITRYEALRLLSDGIEACPFCGRTASSGSTAPHSRPARPPSESDLLRLSCNGACRWRVDRVLSGMAGWTDGDGAAFVVGRSLGIFDESVTFTQVKGVFWTDNPLGNALHEVLLQLVAAGVLERREEPEDEQFRWSGR